MKEMNRFVKVFPLHALIGRKRNDTKQMFYNCF